MVVMPCMAVAGVVMVVIVTMFMMAVIMDMVVRLRKIVGVSMRAGS